MDADDLIRRLADVAGGALQEWGRSSAAEDEYIVNEELQHKLAEVYNKVKQIQGGFTHSDPAWGRSQEVLDYIKGDNNADS